MDERTMQAAHYARTATGYDQAHLAHQDEHYFALSFLVGMIPCLGVRSALDVGSGTGRALMHLRSHCPGLAITGVEPVKELREEGYKKGIDAAQLVEGDATNLEFADGEFDLVTEFGMLHHVRHPERVVSEMLRVARTAVFISDSNNFGQGGRGARTLKQLINSVGLWPLADLVKTRGRGYTVSEGDGLAYSYSVFNNYQLIRRACDRVHVVNTLDADSPDLYRSAPHLALLGIKRGCRQ